MLAVEVVVHTQREYFPHLVFQIIEEIHCQLLLVQLVLLDKIRLGMVEMEGLLLSNILPILCVMQMEEQEERARQELEMVLVALVEQLKHQVYMM